MKVDACKILIPLLKTLISFSGIFSVIEKIVEFGGSSVIYTFYRPGYKRSLVSFRSISESESYDTILCLQVIFDKGRSKSFYAIKTAWTPSKRHCIR